MDRVGVICRTLSKVVILEVTFGHRDVQFARASYAFPGGCNDCRCIETTLILGSRALEQRYLYMDVTLSGQLSCQRETGSTLEIFCGGISRPVRLGICRIATEREFRQKNDVGAGARAGGDTCSQLLPVVRHRLKPSGLDETNARGAGFASRNRAGARQSPLGNEFHEGRLVIMRPE